MTVRKAASTLMLTFKPKLPKSDATKPEAGASTQTQRHEFDMDDHAHRESFAWANMMSGGNI